MRKQGSSKWVSMLMITSSMVVMGWGTSEGWAAEAKYPTRPIRAIIGFAPGTTDVVLRIFTDKLPEYLGQPISYDFKPGAAGSVGASFVANAKPDGYTLLGTSPPPLTIAPVTRKDLDYSIESFTPICRLATTPVLLAVKADSPFKTVKDIIEEAQKKPMGLNYSSAGVFSGTHVSMEIFLKGAGIRMTHIPCAGMAPAVTALLGGHVNMAPCTMAPVSHHIKSGALRPIALFEKERLKELPNVPTFLESGYPAVYYLMWYGFMGPKGTPREVVRTISTAFKKAIEDHRASIEDRLGNMSLRLDFLGPEEFAKELKVEMEVMEKMIKDLM